MTVTSAPASCTSSATAAPIPLAPPTTSARLPSYRKASNSPICALLLGAAAQCSAGSVQPREQHRTCDRSTAVRDHGDLGVARHLTLAAVAAELQHGFVQVPVAVEPARRQLAAVRVERHLAVER